MNVIYNESTSNYLTQNKKYLVIEIYHNIDRKMISFRLIDDFGVPSIHESKHFEFDYLGLEGMIFTKIGNNSVAMLKNIYSIVGKDNNINDLWEKYFNDQSEIVDLINKEIINYAERKKTEIINPSPYGI